MHHHWKIICDNVMIKIKIRMRKTIISNDFYASAETNYKSIIHIKKTNVIVKNCKNCLLKYMTGSVNIVKYILQCTNCHIYLQNPTISMTCLCDPKSFNYYCEKCFEKING